VVVLPEHVFTKTIATITQQHNQDEEHLKPWVDLHQLKCLNGIWYKEGQVVITKNLEGKCNIIKEHHDPLVLGHPGISKTVQIVEHNYWWPQMCKDIADYVQGCADCQHHKVNN
jgi:hypothetical protein